MYNALKTEIAEWIGITKDALHVHVGLAVFFAAVILLRRSPASLVPWLVVLGLEVANELKDIFHWTHGRFLFDIGDAPKDLVNTMIWPTLLLIGFRVVQMRRTRQESKQLGLLPRSTSGDHDAELPEHLREAAPAGQT